MPPVPQYCPACAAPLVAQREGPAHPPRPTCRSCGFIAYDNPIPCAGVIIENARGQVLLGRRARAPFRGAWGVIGGFVEGKEHPEEAARREVEEEVGVPVHIERLLGMWMDRYGRSGVHTLNIIYVGRLLDDAVHPNDDVSELRWFDAHALPRRIGFENGRRALRAWKAERPEV